MKTPRTDEDAADVARRWDEEWDDAILEAIRSVNGKKVGSSEE